MERLDGVPEGRLSTLATQFFCVELGKKMPKRRMKGKTVVFYLASLPKNSYFEGFDQMVEKAEAAMAAETVAEEGKGE